MGDCESRAKKRHCFVAALWNGIGSTEEKVGPETAGEYELLWDGGGEEFFSVQLRPWWSASGHGAD